MRKGLVAAVILVGSTVVHAEDATYQRAPPAVAKFVDALPIPGSDLSPDKSALLLITPRMFPPIAEVAEPELRLAGLRIIARSRAQSRRSFAQRLELLDAKAPGAKPTKIRGIPDGARIGDILWSPDSKHVAITLTETDAIQLRVIDVTSATLLPTTWRPVSGVVGQPCAWLPDSRGLVCRTVPSGAAPPPAALAVPTGPIIQENTGGKRPARTNPDLLTSPSDERLFEHYLSSQIALLKLDGSTTPIGAPALFTSSSPSPDGTQLLVSAVHRPFSYRVAIDQFPILTAVWALAGRGMSPAATIADLPLADEVPVDFDATRTGRRSIAWRADAPATLCWVEARDGGDPRKPVPVRDEVSCAAAPFTRPTRLAGLAHRYAGISWGDGKLALVTERRWKDRKTITTIVAPDAPATPPRVLWDRSFEDRYGDPGDPVMRRTASGKQVLHITSARQLLLVGEGASDEGDRPFFDRLDVATGKAERVWRSEGKRYAQVTTVLDQDGREVLMSRESPSEPPQLYAVSLATRNERELIRFAHPVPELAKVTSQLIKWKRRDGLELSGMMYLPPGFRPKQDRPLPVLVWVYPQEFKTAAAASQVATSPYRFVYPWWGGPLFALAQGYAVIDDPSFAIIGEGTAEPNDTYVDQLTSDASSMIDAVVQLGVGDRDRFAVAGHSYGAFTTANLLAHSKLFRTGIARSGAYNRTLTPFGFQSEERTYWEAAATYDQMSPFRFADKIDAPLLLIHGAADNNTGTFPIQTERLYAAMQGLGARVRYVSLPAEAHGYRARESALHVLWEQTRWLDAHLKNAPPRDAPTKPGKPAAPHRPAAQPAQPPPSPPRPR